MSAPHSGVDVAACADCPHTYAETLHGHREHHVMTGHPPRRRLPGDVDPPRPARRHQRAVGGR